MLSLLLNKLKKEIGIRQITTGVATQTVHHQVEGGGGLHHPYVWSGLVIREPYALSPIRI